MKLKILTDEEKNKIASLRNKSLGITTYKPVDVAYERKNQQPMMLNHIMQVLNN